MKTIFILLCTVAGIVIPGPIQGQERYTIRQTIKSDGPVAVDKLTWGYPVANQPAAATITITNNSDKTIKSTRFLVIARDKKGMILQSDGSTLKKLISTDSIEAQGVRKIYFKKAYNNPHIAELELRELIVEYTNGALERIKQKATKK